MDYHVQDCLSAESEEKPWEGGGGNHSSRSSALNLSVGAKPQTASFFSPRTPWKIRSSNRFWWSLKVGTGCNDITLRQKKLISHLKNW